jgi:hypothetical protein
MSEQRKDDIVALLERYGFELENIFISKIRFSLNSHQTNLQVSLMAIAL